MNAYGWHNSAMADARIRLGFFLDCLWSSNAMLRLERVRPQAPLRARGNVSDYTREERKAYGQHDSRTLSSSASGRRTPHRGQDTSITIRTSNKCLGCPPMNQLRMIAVIAVIPRQCRRA